MVFISILVIIVCILLMLVVLIQNPKGGLDSAFSTNNQVMGVRKTTDFLEKATWTLGILLVVISVASAVVTGPAEIAEGEDAAQSKMTEQIDEKAMPTAPVTNGIPLPDAGTPAAAGQPTEEEGQ
jgi:preprotein translocase subunit SecG